MENKTQIDASVWEFIAKVKTDPDAFFAHLDSKATTIKRSEEELRVIKNHFKMKAKYAKLSVLHH